MNKTSTTYYYFGWLADLLRYAEDISYKAQFNDMRLKDYNDVAGLMRREYIYEKILNCEWKIKEPCLFKLSKSNSSLFLLGTHHQLPIRVYPSNLVKFLFKKSLLITEMAEKTLGATLDPAALSLLSQIHDESKKINIHEKLWLEELPDYCQNWLSQLFESFPTIKTTNLEDTIEALLSIGQMGGMDEMLLKRAPMYDYEIIGLETAKERREISSKFSFDDSKKFISMLNNLKEIIDTYIEYGCLHGSPEFLKFADIYLSSNFLQHKMEINESLKMRNQIWVKRISKLEYLYPEELSTESILIAVGANHLSKFSCEEDNLLSLLNIQGWEITRANLSGEFEEVDL